MKAAIILMLAISFACGKHHNSSGQVFYEQYAAAIPYQYVSGPDEARSILYRARIIGRLREYNQTRWYLNNGIYLFKSIVINGSVYRLE